MPRAGVEGKVRGNVSLLSYTPARLVQSGGRLPVQLLGFTPEWAISVLKSDSACMLQQAGIIRFIAPSSSLA
jgi:hypothetical protein